MTNGKSKVAIVGLNVGVNGHLPAFRTEGWEVAAFCATTGDKVENLAKENGVPGAFTDANYDDMLKIPGLDAVVVASPPTTHADLTLRALGAGKHILVEKPFAPNAAESEKMRAAAASSDRTTMIAEAYRFAPSHAYAKELIDQGYIGQLKTINITLFQGPTERLNPPPAPRLHWRSDLRTGGGFSAGPASTFFDTVIDWFGDITAVRGTVYSQFPGGKQPNGDPHDADDAMTAHFTLANGAWGTFTVVGGAPYGQGATWDAIGTDGSLRVTQLGLLPINSDKVFGGRFDDGPDFKELPIPGRLRETIADTSPKIEPYYAYQAVVRKFAEGIRTGTSPAPNFEDADQLQRITDAVKQSGADGGWVKI